jgi:hypothetical protein
MSVSFHMPSSIHWKIFVWGYSSILCLLTQFSFYSSMFTDTVFLLQLNVYWHCSPSTAQCLLTLFSFCSSMFTDTVLLLQLNVYWHCSPSAAQCLLTLFSCSSMFTDTVLLLQLNVYWHCSPSAAQCLLTLFSFCSSVFRVCFNVIVIIIICSVGLYVSMLLDM